MEEFDPATARACTDVLPGPREAATASYVRQFCAHPVAGGPLRGWVGDE
ncbi:hypothetical protein [Streptomyces sp. NBC_00162]|nr:hypothetical protein [Streptomyces sp. NBC_00162]UUU38047.1 hypothetical protein JIW86_03745 [Streptomyces sp. NBC_00162]